MSPVAFLAVVVILACATVSILLDLDDRWRR